MRFIWLLCLVLYSVSAIVLPLGTLSDVNSVIHTAHDGDVIELSAGTWTGCSDPIRLINKNITISGMPGATIDCGGDGVAVVTASGCTGGRVQSLGIYNSLNAVIHQYECELSLVDVDISGCAEYCVVVAGGTLSVLYSAIHDSGGGINGSHSILNVYSTILMGCVAEYGAGIHVEASVLNANNVSASNNSAGNSGGFLYSVKSYVTLDSCLIMENGAIYGGGVDVDNSNITLNSCLISYNSASYGGAFFIESSSTLTAVNVTAYNNTASANGGFLHSDSSDTSLRACDISCNSAQSGGSIHVVATSTLTLVDVIASSNNASTTGGFIYSESSIVILKSCTLTNNYAEINGGACAITTSTLYAEEIVAANNSAVTGGGVMHSDSSYITLQHCMFANNSAGQYGGAFSVVATSKLSAVNVTAVRNTANSNGGFIYSEQSNVTCISSTFSYSSVGFGGGVMYSFMSDVTLNSCLISYNSASYGGAVFIESSSVLNVVNVTAYNNTASENGGFLHSSYSYVLLSKCDISCNSARNGGAIDVEASSALSAANVVASNNSASATGGFMSCFASSITMSESSLNNNHADMGGAIMGDVVAHITVSTTSTTGCSANRGGAYCVFSSTLNMMRSVIHNCQAVHGGGVCASYNSELSVDKSSMTSNSAADGGAVYLLMSTAKMTSVTIADSNAERGGGVSCRVSSSIEFTESTMVNNSASDNGGFLYSDDSYVALTTCDLTDNYSKYGGGIDLESSSTLNACNVTAWSNLAAERGGFLYSGSSDPTLRFCLIRNNIANYGGAIFMESSSLYSLNNVVSGNEAIISAGFLYSVNSHLMLESSVVSEHTETGAILSVSSTLVMVNTTALNNSMSDSGGFIHADASDISMTSCILSHNYALHGGGLLFSTKSTISLESCVISSNNAHYGGAIDIESSSTLYAVDVTAYNNTADYRGGFIYCDSSDATLTSSDLSYNTAQSGGAAVIWFNSSFSAINVTASNNSAIHNGGFLYSHKSVVTLMTCVLANNNAGRSGGALDMEPSSVLNATYVIASNNSASESGGFIYSNNSRSLLTSCLLTENYAKSGGAIDLESLSSFNADNVTASDNKVIDNGGFVHSVNSNITLNSCLISYNSASYGGAFFIESSSTLSAVNVTAYNNTASANGGFLHSDSSDTSLTACMLRGNKAQYGGAMMFSLSHALLNSCEIVSGSALLGGGIYNTNNSVIHTDTVYIARNDGCGVYNNATFVTDGYTRICRNVPRQVNGSFDGDAVVCGYIHSVSPSSINVWYPGMNMTVNGTEMMTRDNDSIISVNNVTLNTSIIPFTFTLIELQHVYVGPVVVMSYHGVRSESYDDYVFMPYNYSRCSARIDDGLEPPMTIVGTNATVNFTLKTDCGREYTSVVCHFLDYRSVAIDLGSNKFQCQAPVIDQAQVMTMTVSVHFSGHLLNVTTTFEYYPMPYGLTVVPMIAHNVTSDANGTRLTICGMTVHALAKPRCLFENVQSNEATIVNASCISCEYYSSAICSNKSSNFVRVSLYLHQYATQELSVVHVCAPIWQSNSKLDPGYVLMSNDSNAPVFVKSANIHVSDLLSCKFGEKVVSGTASGIGVLCTVPPMDSWTRVMVYISNNRHDWIPTTYLYYGDARHTCDVNTEYDGNECKPCNVNYYKPIRSPDKCSYCLTGGVCAGDRDPVALDGYYSTGHDASDRVFISCLPTEACVNQTCATGYTGTRCSHCDSGYHRVQLECMECSGSFPWLPLLAFVGAVMCAITYLFIQSFKGPSSDLVLAAISIGVSFFQVFALVGSVPSTGGDGGIVEPFKSAFSLFSVFNVNIQAMAYECALPSSFFTMMSIKMLLPVACLAYVWLLVLILHLFKYDKLLYAGASTSVMMMTVLYIAETESVLSFVSCTQLVNGPLVLDASPDIECYSAEHMQWLWLFVLGVLIYVIGVPAFLWYWIVIRRRQLLDTVRSTDELPEWYTFCFGFLSLKYHDYVYWYVKKWRENYLIGGN